MGDENDIPSDVRLRIARFEQNAQKKILPATPSKPPKQLSPVNPSPNKTSQNKSSPVNSPPLHSVSPLQQLHNRNKAVTLLPQTTDKSVDLKPTSPIYAAGIKINRDPLLSPVHPPPSSPGKPLGSSIFPKVQLKSPNTTAMTGVGSKFSPSPGSTVAPSLPTGSSKRDSGRSTGSDLVKVGSRTYRKIAFVAPLRFIPPRKPVKPHWTTIDLSKYQQQLRQQRSVNSVDDDVIYDDAVTVANLASNRRRTVDTNDEDDDEEYTDAFSGR